MVSAATYATKIFKRYGDRSIAVVKQNPYRLASDIFGIGFLKADNIAKELGFSNDARGKSRSRRCLYTASAFRGRTCIFPV